MLVFKKDALGQSIEEIGNDKLKVKLEHYATKVAIELIVTNDSLLVNSDLVYPSDYDDKKYSYNNFSPYKVYKIDDEGLISEFKEFGFDGNKSLLNHFKDAISFFEELILAELQEQEPSPTPPPKLGDNEDGENEGDDAENPFKTA